MHLSLLFEYRGKRVDIRRACYNGSLEIITVASGDARAPSPVPGERLAGVATLLARCGLSKLHLIMYLKYDGNILRGHSREAY